MHPAPSVIVFTSLSGLGFGLLFWLGIGLPAVTGWAAFAYFAAAYLLAVGGLLASTFHLGHPERAIKAFSQWKTSWLSREAWSSVICLLIMAAYGAGLVFFCNPNNPTGTTWPTQAVEGMIDPLARRSPETVILVDEAYAHYVETANYRTLAQRAAKDRRVLVTRTFSKVYGLAGLRIGYAVGHKDTIAALKLTTTSGRLAVTSVAAALAVIEDETLIRDGIRANGEARAAITKSLRDLGFDVLPSDTNFILVDVRQKPEAFQAACKESNVMVGRPFPGLDSHARISVGSLEEMQRAAVVFKSVLMKKA